MSKQSIRIYLDDHLALSTAEVALARRCKESNRDTALGLFLESYEAEAEQDRAEIAQLLRRLGHTPSRAKALAGALGERLGRLKLNGRLFGYSPLSRLVELEGLSLLLQSRAALWSSLAVAAAGDPLIAEILPATRAEIIQEQRQLLEEQRQAAAQAAL